MKTLIFVHIWSQRGFRRCIEWYEFHIHFSSTHWSKSSISYLLCWADVFFFYVTISDPLASASYPFFVCHSLWICVVAGSYEIISSFVLERYPFAYSSLMNLITLDVRRSAWLQIALLGSLPILSLQNKVIDSWNFDCNCKAAVFTRIWVPIL